MPTYVLKCSNGHQFDKYLPLKNYNDVQVCDCGAEAKRITVPTMLSPDIANWDRYISPITGNLITSYKQRNQEMKEHDCIDYDPSIRIEADKRIEEQDRKLDKAIEETVDKEISKMSSDKRDKLARELSNQDLQYTRGTSNG